MSMFVCVSVCREDISGTTGEFFTIFCACCLCRSSSGMLTIGRIAYRREVGDGSAQRGRSVIYDCLVYISPVPHILILSHSFIWFIRTSLYITQSDPLSLCISPDGDLYRTAWENPVRYHYQTLFRSARPQCGSSNLCYIGNAHWVEPIWHKAAHRRR